ncbi:MAG: hypothetical protein JNK04_04295, partial [Myxococcales bacterium]|nr:hypothetical protein [Myxococcales bacterium]
AATYLEQHHFAPDVLLRTFPGLRDASSAVLRTLARDVDADALLAACRPEGAPSTNELWARVSEPPSSRTARPFVPHAHAQRDAVPPAADIARAQGNTIRSLIYRVRAKGTEEAVNDELVAFCNRLSAALVWVDAPTESWAEILLPVLHHTRTALGMPWNAEARMLFDLQKACVDYEREREALGVVEWALSLGKVPVRRPLPAEREVRIAGHVLAALDKVPKMRLPEEHRQALVGLLASLAAQAEQNVRTSLGPRIEAALDSVGLTAHDVTERASRRKLVDELLDQILKDRFIAFGQVRDSLSRNNIKLPDVTSQELVGGDALLRLDRLLARDLDGVYRPGEVYLRSLQKLSSLSFGSRVGRFVSLYLLLPVVAAYVVLAGLEHTVGLVLVKVFGFRHVAYASTVPLVCATVLAFGLIHSAAVRRAALLLWSGIKYLLRAVFIRFPLWVWSLPFVRDLLRTEGLRQFARFVLKPAALAGLLTLVALALTKDSVTRIIVFALAFLAANVLFNSTWGRALEEAATDWAIRSFRQLHRKLLPGLFRLIIAVFKRALEVVERFIYFVDEKLIFRQGESRVTFYSKAVLGVFWFFTTYLIRVYVNLLIEPEVNPIKHFPVVTVAAKIMIPFTEQIHSALMKPLVPLFGVLIAESIAAPTIFVLPGFFGFLVWELKENWRLYRMNRKKSLHPAVIGSHGETMVQFMKPGLHSGTIPKVYAKLRRASRKLDRSALKHTEALRAVEGSIRKFIERELIFLLSESPAWTAGPLSL